jgi:GR25 family glycosyltransferase involved in LPS biosynthesis
MSRPTSWKEFLEGPTYVINMDKSTERWSMVQTRLRDAGFTLIQRISAVDALQSEELSRHWSMYQSPSFDLKKDPEFQQYPGKQGCFLSHVKLWREMMEKQIPWVTVFEDDVLFHPKWKDYAPTYFENVPNDWDLIYLGCQMDFDSDFHIEQGPVYCTHAMVLTLEGAKQLYQSLHSRRDGVYTIDNMFHDMQLQKTFPVSFYIWNARMFPCDSAFMNKGWSRRNHGLVFQDEKLGSYIKDHY